MKKMGINLAINDKSADSKINAIQENKPFNLNDSTSDISLYEHLF